MNIKLFLLLILVFGLSGCGRTYVMDRQDMYLIPSVKEMPKQFTVLAEVLDPVRDIAEGGQGRFAWKSVLVSPDGVETNYLAVSVNYRDEKGNKVLLTMIPKPLAELEGYHYFSLDHGGTRFYNHLGQARKLKSLSKKINPAKHEGFMTVIRGDEPFVAEVSVGSQDLENLTEIYKNFRTQELNLVREYFYKKYGSNLTEEEIDKIALEDSVIRGFADWLGRDWKLFLVFPFTSIGNTAIISGIVKVFTLPSIWGDKINKPGYMEYITDAETTAEMALRAVIEYGHLYKTE